MPANALDLIFMALEQNAADVRVNRAESVAARRCGAPNAHMWFSHLLSQEPSSRSQMLTVPSKLAAAMWLPDGDHATQRIVLE